MTRRTNTGIPGLSFSLKRAVGITLLRHKVSRAIGIPTTKSGIERKVGHAIIKSIFNGFVFLSLILLLYSCGLS